ncbi:MAG: DegT/DnrJ/EryC1/StrS family aminotransferase, partial [Candidatus Methanoperedens sp.]
MIPLAQPDIGEEDIRLVNEVLRSGWLSMGPKVGEFEEKFAGYIGTKHAIAVNSGTSGLHLCVRALGIKKGDEVITTPFSFVASSNCILFEGGKPVFVDIDPDTLNIDVQRIEDAITKDTKAILPVHVFGQPCEMDAIMEIAEEHNLAVIEDACEAIGAEYNGRKAGTFGDASVFAFYPNKQMTTGEGAMIVTDDDELANMFRSMRNQGR